MRFYSQIKMGIIERTLMKQTKNIIVNRSDCRFYSKGIMSYHMEITCCLMRFCKASKRFIFISRRC